MWSIDEKLKGCSNERQAYAGKLKTSKDHMHTLSDHCHTSIHLHPSSIEYLFLYLIIFIHRWSYMYVNTYVSIYDIWLLRSIHHHLWLVWGHNGHNMQKPPWIRPLPGGVGRPSAWRGHGHGHGRMARPWLDHWKISSFKWI